MGNSKGLVLEIIIINQSWVLETFISKGIFSVLWGYHTLWPEWLIRWSSEAISSLGISHNIFWFLNLLTTIKPRQLQLVSQLASQPQNTDYIFSFCILFTSQTWGWQGSLGPGSAMWAWLRLSLAYCFPRAGISLPSTGKGRRGRLKWPRGAGHYKEVMDSTMDSTIFFILLDIKNDFGENLFQQIIR